MATEKEKAQALAIAQARRRRAEAESRMPQATTVANEQSLSNTLPNLAPFSKRPGTDLTERQAMVQEEAERRRLAEQGDGWADTKTFMSLPGGEVSQVGPTPRGAARTGANMGRYGVPAVASIVGSPGAGIATRAGIGLLSGFLSDMGAQGVETVIGDRESIKPGESVAMGVSNILPGGGVVRGAAQNLLAETARVAIDEGRLPDWKEAGIASILGGAAGGVGKLTSSRVLSESDTLLKERNNTFRNMRKKGFKLNPNELKETGLLSWIAGDAPLDVAISRNNNVAAQRMARKAIGAKPGSERFRKPEYFQETGAVKRPGELDDLIAETEAPYKKVRAIAEAAAEGRGTDGLTSDQIKMVVGAEDALDNLKVTRRDATRAWNARNEDPSAYDRYEGLKIKEAQLEEQIETAAELTGNTGLIEELKDARRRLAKIHVVKNATSVEDGIFNMSELPNMRRRGLRLTGELAELEEFAFHFDRNSLNPRQASRDAPSNLNTAIMARQAADMSPAAGGGLLGPIAGKKAREFIQSPVYQRLGVGPINQLDPNVASQAMKLMIAERGRDQSLLDRFLSRGDK